MNKKPDVLGMKMPAAVEILDAAGISHNEQISAPAKMGRHADDASGDDWPLRVIRQRFDLDGNVTLTLCRVPDPDPVVPIGKISDDIG